MAISILFIPKIGLPALVVAGIFSSVVFSNIWLNILTARLLKENVFLKLLLLLFCFTIPILEQFHISIIKYSCYSVMILLVMWILFRKILENKELIRPIYAQIFHRDSKKTLY
jgi:hypothetical protein